MVPRPRQVGHIEDIGVILGCVDAYAPHVVVLDALSTSATAHQRDGRRLVRATRRRSERRSELVSAGERVESSPAVRQAGGETMTLHEFLAMLLPIASLVRPH